MNFFKQWLFKKMCSVMYGGESSFDSSEYMATISQQGAFMIAMKKKIKACQNIEFSVYKQSNEGKEKLTKHTLVNLFKMINKNTSFNDFIDYFLVWYEGYDNGVLLEVVKGLSNFCPDLYIHNPNNFTVHYEGNNISRIEIMNPHRNISGEELENFMWIRSPNYSNVKDGVSGQETTLGYSKHNAFAIWGAYVKKAWEWNWSLAKNLGKPGGILSTEGYVDKEDRKEISDKYTASNGGSNHAGKPLVLGSGLKYQDTSRAPIDTDWNAGEQKAYERTAISTGVPAELVGGGESTYQNRRHAKKELYKDEIIPFFNNLKGWLNYLLRDYLKEGEFIDYDLTGIDELKEDISEVIKNLEPIKNRVTINEYRKFLSKMTDIELEDLGKKGDVILVSAGDVTLDETLEVIDTEMEKEDDI